MGDIWYNVGVLIKRIYMLKKTWIIASLGVLLIVAGLLYYFLGNTTAEADTVVARVNGEEITESDLQMYEARISAGQGIDLTVLDELGRTQLREHALDTLILSVLLEQAVDNSGFTAPEGEVDAELADIKAQFESEEVYNQVLLEQEVTEEELRKQINIEIVSQIYLNEILDFDSLVPTEEEITAFYTQQASISDTPPSLDELHDQIGAYLTQQKQTEALDAHVEELKAKADIEIYI